MPAVEIKESNASSKEMSATEYTGCSLCAISGTHYLGEDNAYAETLKAQFKEHLARKKIQGSYQGNYVQGAICVISEYYNATWKKQEKWLLENGFKLLGIYPGAHQEMHGKPYKNRLYGSKEFELPKQENK